jgi:tight adherence protein C
MPMLLNVPTLPLIAGIFVLVLAVVLFMPAGRVSQPASRVAEYTLGLPGSPGVSVNELSARQRLLDPVLTRVLAIAAGTAPKKVRKVAAQELAMAGSSVSPTVFLGIRGIFTFGFPALVALVILMRGQPTIVEWGIIGASLLLGRRLPSMWLRGQIKKRHRAIDKALPYALDLMVACLEGGLSLNATLAKVTEQGDGPLAEEIRRALQEMTFGRPTIEALRDLGERNGAPDLKRLTDNIVQSERMGVSITQTMRTLAEDSRTRRRQRAEEMARKAPIKMMPVLIFCVLPSVLAILMTPTVIVLMRMFSSLHQ